MTQNKQNTRCRFVRQPGSQSGPINAWFRKERITPIVVGTAIKRDGQTVIQPRGEPSEDRDGDVFYGKQYEADMTDAQRMEMMLNFDVSDLTKVV